MYYGSYGGLRAIWKWTQLAKIGLRVNRGLQFPGWPTAIGQKPSCGRLLPISVQLAFARQDAKEQEKSDDDWRRSDDSYSPRRHWRCRSPTISVGPGLRTDV